MDPVRNSYAPGAGSPPPELAGRARIRNDIAVRLKRLRLGRPAKSMMMVGLRGVGKTVLLDQMRQDAEAAEIETLRIEAPEGRSLPALLAPSLRVALLHLSKKEVAKECAVRSLRALDGFASKLKLTYHDRSARRLQFASTLPHDWHPLLGCGRGWISSDTAT